MARKYYKVERFVSLQYLDEEDDRVENDWIEVDMHGNKPSKAVPATKAPAPKKTSDKDK